MLQSSQQSSVSGKLFLPCCYLNCYLLFSLLLLFPLFSLVVACCWNYTRRHLHRCSTTTARIRLGWLRYEKSYRVNPTSSNTATTDQRQAMKQKKHVHILLLRDPVANFTCLYIQSFMLQATLSLLLIPISSLFLLYIRFNAYVTNCK